MDLHEKFEIAGITDVGLKRTRNEDRIYSALELGLIMVADGMGGHNAGEVASTLAVETISYELKKRLHNGATLNEQDDTANHYSNESNILVNTIKKANAKIYELQKQHSECKGMGTTLVTALFYNNRLTVANVGDSRLYRFRNGKLEQMTIDHTVLQEMIDKGFYTQDEARASSVKNIVTRALGTSNKIEIDIFEDNANVGDIYLLCSDGLNDMVNDTEILLTLEEFNGNLSQIAETLIDKAKSNGGKDNVSVLLAKPVDSFPFEED